ncbi:MAG TPA: YbaB/EbfC family nucleoid-associated protein [Gammaproteobacteria bacterium]|nr:MAG: YbaB/EbfC family nucleoid-associated protein [Gammaproteobacteria bacterium TMED134]RZO70767.1 MAG: YbaB/EbfC family nucleoid-associated protein [OM182 bacterium]HAL41408.1 YbaB/EbfC family nucleoid-associated protein [Gammaproteobacteria bacterium]
MKDFGDLMKQAEQLQSRLQGAQQEMTQLEVVGESGAGMVSVTMNGRYEVRRVEIDPSLMEEERSVLEDLLAAACNDTVRKVEKAQAEKMKSLGGGMLGGLNLGPGKFPF